MNPTLIEWLQNPDGSKGFTWNPVSGCSKVSDGCKHCYAEVYANRFWGGRKFTDIKCHDEKLAEPLKREKPTRVFVNSMSDLFHPDVPFEFIDKVFAVMALAHQHTFMILTKRPERMVEYFQGYPFARVEALMDGPAWVVLPSGRAFPRFINAFPLPNVYLGVSVEDQKTADERIPLLLQTPAATRFVSYEPALGPVDFSRIGKALFDRKKVIKACMNGPAAMQADAQIAYPELDWIIAGGESGPKARPSHPDWFRSARDQCKAAEVPFFFKQWGEWGPGWEFARAATVDRETGETQYPGLFGDKEDVMFKKGKKKAGSLLDGVEYKEFPL